MKLPSRITRLTLALAITVVTGAFALSHFQSVFAAATITVNSTADTAANDGVCTLREAITSANSNAVSGAAVGECVAGDGNDTIEFDIAGTGVKTITLTASTPLPDITSSMTIDGYTQTGASPNTNASPLGLNTELRVEIDGSVCGAGCDITIDGTSNVTIKGLSIYSIEAQRAALYVVGSNLVNIEGNYIGATALGVEAGNGIDGIMLDAGTTNAVIGGSTAAVRNLVSGNSTDNVGADNILVADGSTNSTSNITVAGNIVGLNPAGTASFTNPSAGIRFKDGVKNFTIGGPAATDGNLVAGFTSTGIAITQENLTTGEEMSGGTVRNNYVGYGSNLSTNLAISTANSGIAVTIIDSNVVAGSDISNITITENRVIGAGLGGAIAVLNANGSVSIENVTIQSNILDGDGVANISGLGFVGNLNGINASATSAAQSNTIFGFAKGVNVMTLGASPTNISLFGNNIYDNTNHGIDLCADTDFNFVCDSSAGPTANDADDPDSGANAYINYPVLSSVTQLGNQLTAVLDLDAIGSPSTTYRVDFYSNDAADGSGFGEGQTHLGGVNVSPGTDIEAVVTLPDGVTVDGKVVTSTATAVNNTLFGGHGSTSEFGAVLSDNITYTPAPDDPEEETPATTSGGAASAGGALGETGAKALTQIAALVFAGSLVTLLVWKLRTSRSTR